MIYLVECDIWPEDAEKLLAEALAGRAHTITRMDEVGEVAEAGDGYPWKQLSCTNERALANLPLGSTVYGEYR